MKGLAGILLAAGAAAALVGIANAQPIGDGPRAVLFDQPNFQGRSVTIVEGSPDLSGWDFAARPMSGRFEGDWTLCDARDLDGRCATVRGDVADLEQLGLRRIVSLGEAQPDDSASRGDRGTRYAMAGEDARGDQRAPGPDDVEVRGARLGERGSSDPRAATSAAVPTPTVTAQAAAVAPAFATPPAPMAPRGPTAPPQLALASRPAATQTTSAAEGDAGRSAVFFARPTRGGAEVTVDVQGPANQFCRDQGLGPAVYFDTDGRVLRDVLCRRS